MLPREMCTYSNKDSTICKQRVYSNKTYSIEYLNTLYPSRMSLSILYLKIRCPIIFLYNMALKMTYLMNLSHCH